MVKKKIHRLRVNPINLSEYRSWWIANDTDDRLMVEVQEKLFSLGYYWRGSIGENIFDPQHRRGEGSRMFGIGKELMDSPRRFGCWVDEDPPNLRSEYYGYIVSATQFLKGNYV